MNSEIRATGLLPLTNDVQLRVCGPTLHPYQQQKYRTYELRTISHVVLFRPHLPLPPAAGCAGATGESILHGAGLHFEPSGSRLKLVLVMNGIVRYVGSSTTVTTSM